MHSGGDRRLHVDVRKRVAGFELDATFDAATGVTVVVGHSGAGKSTLLQCIAGLRDPDEGRVAVGERVLFDSGSGTRMEPARRRVGYLVQDLALFPHLSVEENVMYGLRHLDPDERRRRMQEIMESFQVAHLCRRSPRDISGGEQQRVALARALVTEPSVLLLDEPLSSLDPGTKARIIEDLQRWNHTRRIPILYVTHDQGELLAMGDRVVVLEQGRITEQGVPTDVTLAPPAAAAQRAGFDNVFDATVVEHRGDGTMVCRVVGTNVVLLAPSAPVPVGVEVSLGVRAGDILLSCTPPRMLTACNVLPGTIRHVERNGSGASARVTGGAELRVLMDAPAADAMAAEVAMEVWMVFGASACQLVRPVQTDGLRRLFVFVCHSNTVRSPMAQAICNAEIARRCGVAPDALDRLGILAVSAGLRARPGEPLDDAASLALAELGLPAIEHHARNLTIRVAARAEAIFCMTEAQRRELLASFPAAESKSHRLDPDADIGPVHGRGVTGLVDCARQLQELVRRQLTALEVGA